jgi:gamma-glutamyltranspeptidase/glutathione hydrolase
MRYFLLVFLCKAIFIHNAHAGIQPEPDSGFINKNIAKSDSYMVVAANELATKAGVEIIKKGGTAIDAAIAVQMVLNVVEPQSSGIGGGGFLLFYDSSTKEVYSFDGRETAPKYIDYQLFVKNDGDLVSFYDAVQGGKSVGVPGLLAMLKMAHEKYGKLRWNVLFDEAIRIAENGFPMSLRLHKVASSVSYMNNFENASSMFLKENGDVKEIGTILYNNKLADIFKIISHDGGESFYDGGIAEDIVRAVSESKINPGYLKLDDLKDYTPVERAPVCINYKKYKVCGMAPPSSGAITIGQALGMLSFFDIRKGGAESLHIIMEAVKLAFADRNRFIADSDFVKVPIEKMLDKSYLKKRSELINANKSTGIYKAGDINSKYSEYSVANEAPSTTHISIVDKQGNAVSLTSSIEHAFGSVLMTNGFLLNNQLTDFSFRSKLNGHKVANRIEGGKRPRSSMSPTIILDENNELFMVIGSPGGSSIIPYVLNVIVAVIDWGMDIQEAINIPHFINKNSSTTYVELGRFSNDTKQILLKIGHKVKERDLNSGLHGIVIKNGIIYGGADPRREGVAIGE